MTDINDRAAAQMPRTSEEIRNTLERYKNGEIKNSFQNCVMALSFDPDLRGKFRRNLLTERIDLSPPLPWTCRSKTVNDTEMNFLLWYIEQVYGLSNEKKILKTLDIVSSENRYHPIQDYLNRLKWDGKERIRHALRHFLGSDESDYTKPCYTILSKVSWSEATATATRTANTARMVAPNLADIFTPPSIRILII